MRPLTYALAVLALALLAWAVVPAPVPPLDHGLLEGAVPDSTRAIARTGEPTVLCVWSWRDGRRYRVPSAAAPLATLHADPRLWETPRLLVGDQLCYRLTPLGSRT